MGVVAEFRVWHDGLVLADALERVSAHLELTNEVATDPARPMLFFWASDCDFDRFEAAMERDPTVTDVCRYADAGDERLYRVRITDAVEVVSYTAWIEAGADQLGARYEDGWWHNRMLFPDEDAFEAVREWSLSNGFAFELDALYAQSVLEPDAVLSDRQREALRTALDAGFFEILRAATISDVGDELGISPQATSERLRRAMRALGRRYLRP